MITIFGKKGKSEINWPMVLLVVITIAILVPALPEKLSEMAGLTEPEPEPQEPTTPSPTPGCYIEDTTVTLKSEEMFNPATTPGGDNRVWLDGDDQGYTTDSGSFTASPGNKYKILWVENSTTHYGKVTEGTIPCTGTLKLNEKLYQWDVGRSAASWAIVTNEDGTLNKAGHSNLSLGLGVPKSVDIQLRATHEDAIGNPEKDKPNVLSCRYNSSSIDSLELSTGYNDAETPNMVSAVSGFKWKSWEFPALVSNDKLDFAMTITADSTYDPLEHDAGGGSSDVFCRLDDGDYDRDADTNEIIFGAEDDQDNNLGLTTGTHNFTIKIE